MQEDKWETLTTKQRIDALQTVANIEAHYLGLLNELNVGASNLREFALGCYSDKTHTISIDIEHLENDPVYEVLDTCCHEAYHSYQHRLVDVYNTTDTSSKCLRLYKKAVTYSQKFGNHENGYEDFCSYYYQKCESDARDYAEEAVLDYYERILKYLDEQNED